MKIIALENNNGRNFIARRVDKGDKYGLNMCLTHDDDRPLIEFTDITNIEKPQGLPAYYLHTLQDRKRGTGLMFFTYAPEWCISGLNMDLMIDKLS